MLIFKYVVNLVVFDFLEEALIIVGGRIWFCTVASPIVDFFSQRNQSTASAFVITQFQQPALLFTLFNYV